MSKGQTCSRNDKKIEKRYDSKDSASNQRTFSAIVLNCGDYGECTRRKITLAKGKLKSSSKLVKVKTSTDLSCVTISNHRNHVLS